MNELKDALDELNQQFHDLNDLVSSEAIAKSSTHVSDITTVPLSTNWTFITQHMDLTEHYSLIKIETGSKGSLNELPGNNLPKGPIVFNDAIPLTGGTVDISGTKCGVGYVFAKDHLDGALLSNYTENQLRTIVGGTLLSTIPLHEPTPTLEFKASINAKSIVCETRGDPIYRTIGYQFEIADIDFIETHCGLTYDPLRFINNFTFKISFSPEINIMTCHNVVHGSFKKHNHESNEIITDADTFADGTHNGTYGYFFRFLITSDIAPTEATMTPY